MHETKLKIKNKYKPRIKSKNKSYTLDMSALYNLSTKRRLVGLLHKPISVLEKSSNNSNYRVFYLKKPNGAEREIQVPILALDILQTRLASLLVRITMPDYVHSGIKGRSNITNARIHVGVHPVLTMDLRNFYPSVTKRSIYHFFFSTMKASTDVAGILAELCTYQAHLPTGSRISMPLSFWANHQMFERLYLFCKQKNVTMSLYVDDLTFSGVCVNELFKRQIEKIIEASGLQIHMDKSRLYKKNQPKLITGVIVDENGIRVKNKHHKAIYHLFNELDCENSDKQLEKIRKKLIGQLNAAGQIESIFKERARNTYQLFNNIKNTA